MSPTANTFRSAVVLPASCRKHNIAGCSRCCVLRAQHGAAGERFAELTRELGKDGEAS